MENLASKKPRGRPVRQKVGVKDKLLIINKDPNKVYRLVNSDPTRIYEMQQLGYEIDTLSEHIPQGLRASAPSLTDNALPVGGGQTQVLMSIDKEEYELSQKEKQEYVDELELGLKPNVSDGQYGSISVKK
jgi:hypothetical protein